MSTCLKPYNSESRSNKNIQGYICQTTKSVIVTMFALQLDCVFTSLEKGRKDLRVKLRKNPNVLYALLLRGMKRIFEQPPCLSNFSFLSTHNVWKLLKMSHSQFWHFHQFLVLKVNLSGSTVWPQATGFQNIECDFFGRFSNTVSTEQRATANVALLTRNHLQQVY